MAKTGLLKIATSASFLLVLVSALIFLYAQSFTPSPIFPQDTESWNKILTGYLVFLSLTLVTTLALAPEVVRGLAKATYWKSFVLRFIPTAIFYFVILVLIKGLLKGPGSVDLLNAISYLPLGVLLVHLFVVSQVEELMFGGLLFTAIDKKYGNRAAQVITIISFALFHYAKTGGNFVVMAIYIPLRYWFNYQRNNGTPLLNKLPGIGKMFAATPETQQSNAGAHFAWNLFIIGFNPMGG